MSGHAGVHFLLAQREEAFHLTFSSSLNQRYSTQQFLFKVTLLSTGGWMLSVYQGEETTVWVFFSVCVCFCVSERSSVGGRSKMLMMESWCSHILVKPNLSGLWVQPIGNWSSYDLILGKEAIALAWTCVNPFKCVWIVSLLDLWLDMEMQRLYLDWMNDR